MKRSWLLLFLILIMISGCGIKQPDNNLSNMVRSEADVTPNSSEEALLNTTPSGVITEVPTPTLLPTPIPILPISSDYELRQEYIEKMKATLSCGTTSFQINGKEFDLQTIDPSINAITDCIWFGNSMLQEPYLFLECHINPRVGYGAIFDVEKMDFIFGAYGTCFTYQIDNAESLVYAFDNCIYNYWGDILYQNTDKNYYIYDLNYLVDSYNNAVNVTLSKTDAEELKEVICLNYHTAKEIYPELDAMPSKDTEALAEFNADLNHDGSDENLNLYKTEYGGDLAFLELTDTNGNPIRLEFAHTSHAGWNSVYLCTLDKKDYLLILIPISVPVQQILLMKCII